MMPKASVYIATSLDGFIAREDGDIDWLEHDSGGEDYGYQAFMDSVDTLVMGRNSYEKVLTFESWLYEGKPVVVLSHTLSSIDIPDHLKGKVEISTDSPTSLMDKLGTAGNKHLYIDGGKVIQSFLREGLIQEMTISLIPVLIGKGIPLFGPLANDIKLTHLETKTFTTGLVQNKYRVQKASHIK